MKYRDYYERNVKGWVHWLPTALITIACIGAAFIWDDPAALPWVVLGLCVMNFVCVFEARKEIEKMVDMADREYSKD